MEVTRIGDAHAYQAPKHHDRRELRLQGFYASPREHFWVGLSHFLPAGGAEADATPLEKVYVVLHGTVTITTDDGEQELGPLDSCHLAPGERRAIDAAPQGQPLSLVDAGCGYGDLLRSIRRWTRRRGIVVPLRGVDVDPQTIRIAQAATEERELSILESHLEASLLAGEEVDLEGAIADHRASLARRRRPGDRDRTAELRDRPGWGWLKPFRRLDDYERALARVHAEAERAETREPAGVA